MELNQDDRITIISDLRILLDRFARDCDSIKDKWGRENYEGLCIILFDREYCRTTQRYVLGNVPQGRTKYQGYAWSETSKVGRMRWLKKHIEKLTNEL